MDLSEQWNEDADMQSFIDTKHKPKDLKYAPGVCKICGLHYDVLLKLHAKEHGYDSEYDMINDGQVIFDFERYRGRRKCKQ